MNQEYFDVEKFVDGLDGTFDGDVDDLDLPDDVKDEVAKLAAKLELEAEDEDPEIYNEPDGDEYFENAQFEQADEWFGDHPI